MKRIFGCLFGSDVPCIINPHRVIRNRFEFFNVIKTLFIGVFMVPAFILMFSSSVLADAPVADAGGEMWATKYLNIGHIESNVGATATLNGSRSFDSDGDSLTYDWTLLDKPVGSSATLIQSATPFPFFSADKEGIYKIQLKVNDGVSDSSPDTVEIEAKKRDIQKINWGNPYFLEGSTPDVTKPSIAMNDHGVVIEVDGELLGTSLYYRVGQRLRGGIIDWGIKTYYSNGHAPSVAINDDGIVVEVHQGELPTKLYRKVGIVDVESKTISFGSADDYTKGWAPSVAINDNGVVVAVHQAEVPGKLYRKVGIVDVAWRTINFGGADDYSRGFAPSVAINNHGVVVEVHQGELPTKLYHKVGIVDTGSKTIHFGDSNDYTDGFVPSVAINDDGIVVEVHRDSLLNDLWYKLGTCDGTTLTWKPASRYAFGCESPSVALNNKNQFIEINRTLGISTGLDLMGLSWHSTSDFMPTRNSDIWMKKTPSVMSRKLKDVYLPGTHDSGAYEFFNDKHSPTYVEAIEIVEDVLFNLADAEIEACVQQFALAQDTTILEQLNGGIRFLDLRIYMHEDDLFYIHHSSVGNQLDVILDDIKSYMDGVQKELLVVQSWINSQELEDKDHERLMHLYKEKLGEYLYETEGNESDGYLVEQEDIDTLLYTNISEIVKDGPKIIVIYKDKDDYRLEASRPDDSPLDPEKAPYNPDCRYFWPVFDFETWANNNLLNKLYENQKDAFKCYYGIGDPDPIDDPPPCVPLCDPSQTTTCPPPPYLSKIFRLQYILTPQWDDFVNYGSSLLNGYHPSLHSLSQRANQHLGVYLENYADKPIQLITVDFFEESDVVARAINLNQNINIAPTTSASIVPSPNDAGWNNTNVVVFLAAGYEVNGSGSNEIHYRLSGSQKSGEIIISENSAQISITTEGVTTITYWSVNNAGVEDSKSLEIKLDKTAPEVHISATPQILWPVNNKPVDVTVNGSISDRTSGVASIIFDVTDEYGKVEPVIDYFGSVIQLISSRKGNDLDGRHYTIDVTIFDAADNFATDSTSVVCPHDYSGERL